MNAEDPPQGEPSAVGASADPAPPDQSPATVTSCGLRLTAVRLGFLICTPGEAPATGPVVVVGALECVGALVTNSQTPEGFTAEVSWKLAFPEGSPKLITISGKHQAIFSVRRAISQVTAKYYAEVNSVILVYPYLRQLVDDLSVKALGYSIMIPPLDVPGFVEDRRTRMQRQRDSAVGPVSDDTEEDTGS